MALEQATTQQALAGSARVDITPSWPVMQGGYGQRTTPSTGILDQLHAKALYLRSGDEALLVITADLIAIPGQLARPVLDAVAARTGLEPRQICICASHTHSGPLPYGPVDAPGVADYTVFLQEALIEVALAARADPRPCRIGTGVGTVNVFRNRRTRWEPNIVDPRVAVLTVHELADPRPTTVLFGVGCHPVTLGWDNMGLSGDFPGVAQRRIEAELGVGEALFFNSTEGNVVPATSPNRNSLDPRGYLGGTYADAEHIGATIADEVVRVARSIEPSVDLRIGSARRDLTLAPNNAEFDLPTAEQRLAGAHQVLVEVLGADFEARAGRHLWALASEHVVATDCSEDEMRRLMIAVCQHLGLTARVAHGKALDPVGVPVQVLRINELELLALPGEVLVEVGQEWSARTANPAAFVVGLANGHLRYLPRQSQFAEPDADEHYETVTAGLAPSGVERALDAATEMLPLVRSAAAASTSSSDAEPV